jgi:hypothetical protein
MSLIKKIHITWDIYDVLSIRPDLTELQASEILQFVEKNHDANEGINWGVIEIAIDILFSSEEP